MGCETLATKAELESLRSEFLLLVGNKIDRSDRQPIIQESVGLAESRYGLAMVPTLLPALAKLLPYVEKIIQAVIAIGGLLAAFFTLKSATNSVGDDIKKILGRLRFVEEKNAEQDAVIHSLKNYIIPVLKADINVLNNEVKKANNEIGKANNEINRLSVELSSANAQISKLASEIGSINSKLVNEYRPVINLAIEKANLALLTIANLGGDLIEQLREQYGRIGTLEGQISQINSNFNKTISTANAAIERANKALAESNKAAAEANDAKRIALESAKTATNANTTATDANTTANNNKQEITKIWSPTVWEPIITNAFTRVSSPLRNISIQEASNAIQKTFADVSADIQSKINRSEFQDAIAKDAGIQDIRRRLGNTETKLANIPILTSGNVSTSTTTNTTTTSTLSTEITNLNRRVSEQERVNNTAITKLNDISSKIDNIPVTAAGLIVPFIPTARVIENAAAAGTCRTTQPGGCLNNQFQGLQNGQSNLLQKLDLGLQTGQGVLLKEISDGVSSLNTKIGSYPLVGGVTGALSSTFSFLSQSRFMEVVTLIGVMHNALMLSNNVEKTLFSIIDNLINTGVMIVNPKGELVQSESWVGKKVDEYFGLVLGAKTWADIKTGWKQFNSIYSTGANLLSNVQSIISDTQNIQNITNGWVAQLGNGLQNEGLIGEDNWKQKPENPQFKSGNLAKMQQMAEGIQQVNTALESINSVTQSLLNVVQQGNEIKKNLTELDKQKDKAISTASKIHEDAIDKIELPSFKAEDLF